MSVGIGYVFNVLLELFTQLYEFCLPTIEALLAEYTVLGYTFSPLSLMFGAGLSLFIGWTIGKWIAGIS